jgi:hypothetical protein
MNFIITHPKEGVVHYTNAPYLRIAPNGVFVKTKISVSDEMETEEEWRMHSSNINGFITGNTYCLFINGEKVNCYCITLSTIIDITLFNGSLFKAVALGEGSRHTFECESLIIEENDNGREFRVQNDDGSEFWQA